MNELLINVLYIIFLSTTKIYHVTTYSLQWNNENEKVTSVE